MNEMRTDKPTFISNSNTEPSYQGNPEATEPCCDEGPCRETALTIIDRRLAMLKEETEGLVKLASAIDRDPGIEPILYKLLLNKRW